MDNFFIFATLKIKMILELLSKYKKVVSFILIFSTVYFLFSLLYNIYIVNTNTIYYPDVVTYNVSWFTKEILEFWSYDIELEPDAIYKSQKLYFNNQLLFNIVEGCNGLSVIILFLAFVIALKSKPFMTLGYILLGSVSLYFMNILRLVILTLGYYYYPQQRHLMHDVFFPLIIYGLLLLLWIIWIKINVREN